MKNIQVFLLPTLILVLIIFFTSPALSTDDGIKEIKRISERIMIKNFLNAISLDKDQLYFVLQKAREAHNLREEIKNKIESRYEDFISAYRKVEDEIEQGRVVVEKQIAREFHKAKKQIDNLKYQLNNNLKRLADEIKSQLKNIRLLQLISLSPVSSPVLWMDG